MATISAEVPSEVMRALEAGETEFLLPIREIELREQGSLLATTRRVVFFDRLGRHPDLEIEAPTLRVYVARGEEEADGSSDGD